MANKEQDKDLFPNEAEATELLSNGSTLIKGIELVLGRPVQSGELKSDDFLRDMVIPADGPTRYALLLMKKSLDPKEQQEKSTDL